MGHKDDEIRTFVPGHKIVRAEIPRLEKIRFNNFQADLLRALKADGDHRIELLKSRPLKSSRYGGMVKLVDVEWDRRADEIVLVGAFMPDGRDRAADDAPKPGERVLLTLEECYDDMYYTNGREQCFLDDILEAARRKYLLPCVDLLKKYDMFEDGVIDFRKYGFMDICVLKGGEGGRDRLITMDIKDKDLPYVYSWSPNQITPPALIETSKLSVAEIRQFGESLGGLVNAVRNAADLYLEGYSVAAASGKGSEESQCLGILKMYGGRFHPAILHAVTKEHTGKDFFNPAKYTSGDIRRMMERFSSTGVLRAEERPQKPYSAEESFFSSVNGDPRYNSELRKRQESRRDEVDSILRKLGMN